MAFSFRQIISNIPYFKKSDEDSPISAAGSPKFPTNKSGESNLSNNNKEKNGTEKFAAKSASLSEADLNKPRKVSNKERKRINKLKLDIDNANKLLDKEKTPIENTPQQVNLNIRSSEIFSERMKEFDLNKSFNVFDLMNEEFDVQSLSDNSDSDISLDSNEVKMCRKVQLLNKSDEIAHSSSLESFTDVEVGKTEDERALLLQSYDIRFEKLHSLLCKILTDFQFHIEITKIFHKRSVLTMPELKNNKALGNAYIDNLRSQSPTWNVIVENEDQLSKFKLRKKLLTIKHLLETFINVYLQDNREIIRKPTIKDLNASSYKTPAHMLTFTQKKSKEKRNKINKRKRDRRINDFPDYKESLENLFRLQNDFANSDLDNSEICTCKCHNENSQTDSGLTKDDKSNQSITSSIGNFSLDTTSLTVFSESLDNISYNSYDSTLYSSLIQKPAIERIKFYVKVHSIEMTTEMDNSKYFTFLCHTCNLRLGFECEVIKHILGKIHCEKIHFLYKTAYIKECMSSGKEIQPSTVLNPMIMYRDDNKIVCFGDGHYACTLCFENNIEGESVLIEHCNGEEHVERKEQLGEFLEENP